MWVPPTSTFPGHQLTCALIRCALVRMKPEREQEGDEEEELGSRPVSTIARS